jgi:diguanylate cyclase (GGDEF)-like protein
MAARSTIAITVKAGSQATRRPISRSTVVHMVRLFDSLFQERGFRDPLCDITQLSTYLFGMGFDRTFLSKCEYSYFWNFSTLFPELYDGSFFTAKRQPSPALGETQGQDALLGLATFLYGMYDSRPDLQMGLYDAFKQSLLNDGYQFIERRLVETGVNTCTSPELAGLPNRESLLRDISTQMQSSEPVAILFVDLDNFKQVNDKLGHDEGDKCLTIVVQTITTVLRQKGRLYRVGGDEFCVLLPNFSNSEAAATAERVRASIDGLKPFQGSVKITASIGFAVSGENQLRTPDALCRAADEAMYVAKFTSKNRLCTWPPSAAESAEAEANRKKSDGP